MRLPDLRKFEFAPRESGKMSRNEALEKVLELAAAAGALGIPFVVEHVRYEAFRGGGNVSKAQCEAYQLVLRSQPERVNP